MATLGAPALGTSTLAGSFARAAPTVAITAPTGTVNSTPLVVTWTYTSPVARTQYQYRIRLLSEDGSTVVYDTGFVVSAVASASLDIFLSAGSTYTLEVTAADLFDWSAAQTLLFFYDGNDLNDVVPLATVGSVYEVGINGRGYMLADHPEDRDVQYRRQVVPLEAPRFATGDTPFSEAIERYVLSGHTDFSDGAGQRFYKRDSSSEKAYYTSTGINPFVPGEVRLLPATATFDGDGYPFYGRTSVVASNELYVVDNAGTGLRYFQNPTDGLFAAFSIAAIDEFRDMTSDGTYWYLADGLNVFRNNTGADPGAAWSTENVHRIEWCSDRIVAAIVTGASSFPNALATLNYTTGAISGPGAGSTAFTFEEDTDIRAITSGDGYVWFGTSRFDRSVIWAWQLGSTDSYFTAFEVPAGQEIRAIKYYLGNVFIRCSETTETGAKAIIYRGVPSNGALTVTTVVTLEDDGVDHSEGVFCGDGDRVYFSWRGMEDTASGIGAINLSTGGWAKWLLAQPSNANVVRSINLWYGRAQFVVDSIGSFLEEEPGLVDDLSVSSGELTLSVEDLNSSLRKRYTNVKVNFDPLPVGATITVGYSLDGGSSFTTLSPSVTTDGAKTADWDIDVTSDSIQLKLTLTHGSTTTPVVRSIVTRVNGIGLGDQVLVLPVNCSDRVADLRQRPLDENVQGAGAARARYLESLCQSSVVLQDIDYQTTRVSYIYDVVACDIRSVGVYNRNVARQQQSMIAVLTLRRSLR